MLREMTFATRFASICIALLASLSCRPAESRSSGKVVEPHKGDLSMKGGSATIRKPYLRQKDDPTTTNDESNDQPVGILEQCGVAPV